MLVGAQPIHQQLDGLEISRRIRTAGQIPAGPLPHDRTGRRNQYREKGTPMPRTFHVLDIEDCCDSGLPDRRDLEAMLPLYAAAAHMTETDHGIASTSRSVASWMVFSLPHQFRWISAGIEPGAADSALLRAVDEGLLARRYGRLVIGSGDGAFAGLAARLRRRGLYVEVVAREGHCAPTLREAAHQVHDLGHLALAA
jgi:hypothetical protein